MANPFNRLLSLTYNGVKIGQDSTIGEPDGGWDLWLTPETGVVKMRFEVASTNSNALANMAAIEAAFSVRRKALTIVYNNATTINSFDPTLATLTGYEAFPEIHHGDALPGPHSIGGETYEITVRFRRPADNKGRRDEHPALHRTLAQRRKVMFDGVWTAVSGSQGAREQLEDAVNGFEPHATTFLANYDNTVSWTEAVHELVENDTNTECTYHCEFWENVHGQVNEERTVHQDLHQLRRVLVHGTWIDPAGVLSGSPFAALAAFNDATNGFVVQINAWLAANYAGSAFALYSVDPRVNAINGTVDYSAELWEVEEISSVVTGRRFSRITVDILPSGRFSIAVSVVYMQTVVSNAIKTAIDNYDDVTNGGVAYLGAVQGALNTRFGRMVPWGLPILNRQNYNEQLGIVEAEYTFKEVRLPQSAAAALDPDVVDDQWDLVSTTEAHGDSPAVPGGASIASSGTSVRRPVILEATYRAWLKFGVDPMTKWTGALQAYVVQVVNNYLKPLNAAGSAVRIVPEVDPANNTLAVHITLESYVSAFLELSVEENLTRDFGLIFTPKLSGELDDYLEQHGPSVGTKTRTTRLLSTQAGAIFQFASPDAISGYRRLRYSVGQKTIVRGIPPLQTTLYAAELVEEFLAVKSAQSSNRTITQSGTGKNPVSFSAQGANGGGTVPSVGNGFGAGSVGIGLDISAAFGGAQGLISSAQQGADGGGSLPAIQLEKPDVGVNLAFVLGGG